MDLPKKYCSKGLHIMEPGRRVCQPCRREYHRQWVKDNGQTAKQKEHRRRMKFDPEYRAEWEAKKKLREQEARNKRTKKYKKRNTRQWILETKYLLEAYINCWQGAPNRGYYLPKESLHRLIEIREKAIELKNCAVQDYKKDDDEAQ